MVTTYGHIDSGTLAERVERTLHRKLERVATMQAIMDTYADASRYVPDAVTADYEVAVSDALRFAEYWGLDTGIDC